MPGQGAACRAADERSARHRVTNLSAARCHPGIHATDVTVPPRRTATRWKPGGHGAAILGVSLQLNSSRRAGRVSERSRAAVSVSCPSCPVRQQGGADGGLELAELAGEGGVTSAHQDRKAEHPARKQVQALEQHPPSQPAPRLVCWRTRRSAPQSSIRALQDTAPRNPVRRVIRPHPRPLHRLPAFHNRPGSAAVLTVSLPRNEQTLTFRALGPRPAVIPMSKLCSGRERHCAQW